MTKPNVLTHDILKYIIPAVVFLISMGVSFIEELDGYLLRKNCTAVTSGTVVSVESHRRNKKVTNYTADIEPDAPALFGGELLHAGKRYGQVNNHHEYKKGDRVKIYFKPSDSSRYYIQYDKPAIWLLPWLAAAAPVVFGLYVGVCALIKKARERKRGSAEM